MKLLQLFAVITLLAGCAAAPVSQIALTPRSETLTDLTGGDTSIIVAIQSKDLRTAHYLISIERSDKEQVQLVSSATNLRSSIEQSLIKGWNSGGIGFVDASPTTVTVEITQLANRIVQKNLSYTATSEMTLRVTVDNPKSTLTKLYRSTQTNNGPFYADIQKQEQLMSQQLSELLQQILTDTQLVEAFKS
jgi:uncharacterized lipoprotein YajG